MCGICGVTSSERGLVRRMLEKIRHRGPDSKGIFLDESVTLGAVRLSIRDTDKRSDQPFVSESDNKVLLFNGEIYELERLKKKISEKTKNGFNTCSDTEVLLRAYDTYGIKAFNMLNGIFACAIFDPETDTLILARDNFGVKPLYYTLGREGFIFSSELKAFHETEDGLIPDRSKIGEYLAYRYVSGRETIFKKVFRLKNGEILKYNISSGDMKIHKIRPPPCNPFDSIKEFKKEFKESVNDQTSGDVPFGVFLSGGLDSTGILSVLEKTEGVKTYSIGIPNTEGYVDERVPANMVSEHFGTDHVSVVVDESSLSEMGDMVYHLDEPIADPAALPTFLLSRRASKDVKFVLAGDGADELFGGYAHHSALSKLHSFSRIPMSPTLARSVVKSLPVSFLDRFVDYPSSIGEDGRDKIAEMFLNSKDLNVSYDVVTKTFSVDELKRLGHEKVPQRQKHLIFSDFTTIRSHEFRTWLPDYILPRLDKMSMAHSLESRVPFLDHRVANRSLASKDTFIPGKKFLRSALKGSVPDFVMKRKKYPFTSPVDAWIPAIKEELSALSEEVSSFSTLVNISEVKKTISLNQQGLISGRKIWSLFVLCKWCEVNNL